MPNSTNTIEKLISNRKLQPSPELDERVYRAIEAAEAGRNIRRTADRGLGLWASLAHARFAQRSVATIAVLLCGAVLALLLTRSVTEVRAIERVIAAYDGVRFLHVRSFHPGKSEVDEFWIRTDPGGKVAQARYLLLNTEDGTKVITWSPERAEIWFKNKARYRTFRTTRIQGWMQEMLQQSQPQTVLAQLLQAQKAGQLDLNVEPGPADRETMIITANHKTRPRRDRYYVDRKTQLITRIEYSRIEQGREVLSGRLEFSNYNVPIDEQMFSLRNELPSDVRIADEISQLIGVPQANMTDQQAAVETVRQFFRALLDKDYRAAGLIVAGEIEEHARSEYGTINIGRIVSIGPAVAQPDWDKHGFKVPCELEIVYADGAKATWKPQAYVRPGDDELHPDRWNITGGINPYETEIRILPDNEKYQKMSPREAALAFLTACAEKNWTEFAKFSVAPLSDPRQTSIKEYLGGLQVISVGEAFKGTNGYPGWYVPYEIKLRPREVHLRLSNANAAKRFVVVAVHDRGLKPLREYKWTTDPPILPGNDAYARMSPLDVAKAYLRAQSSCDWEEMRKFASPEDVEKTRHSVTEAEENGMDPRQALPVWEPLQAFWSADHSAWFVKCRVTAVKKWNLAIRNDNPAGRFMWDGGL